MRMTTELFEAMLQEDHRKTDVFLQTISLLMDCVTVIAITEPNTARSHIRGMQGLIEQWRGQPIMPTTELDHESA